MIGDLPAHALAIGLDIGPEGLVCYRAPGAGGEIYEDVAREERLNYARQAVALRGSLHAFQEARRGLDLREVEHLSCRPARPCAGRQGAREELLDPSPPSSALI